MKKTVQYITIGTRGGPLALKQSELVAKKLRELDPSLHVEIRIIKTKGDVNLKPIPLDVIGKGWFTKEIEKKLMLGKIDLAVHSLKDLPEKLPRGLVIGAILKREDSSDVLVSYKNTRLQNLSTGSVIGTDSLRRKIQILALRPDVVVKSIRGNVPTRIKKLDEGKTYNAIILAAAGLKRLGLKKRITQYFNPKNFTPAPGQGALAVEIRQTDLSRFATYLKKLNNRKTFLEVVAERTFSSKLGGGCKVPIGAYGEIKKSKLSLYVMAGTSDGRVLFRDTIIGPKEKAEKLGKSLALKILKRAQKRGLKKFV